jgi:arsenate reductase
MAEGFLKSLDASLSVFSAGVNPAPRVHPDAVFVMKEKGIDIGEEKPVNVSIFLNENFDYVITVCDNAKETCPNFTGKTENRVHLPFDDPAEATGTREEVLNEFREVRDSIFRTFTKFYREELKDERVGLA